MLHRFALERLEEPAIESRQRCVRDLTEALRLDPGCLAGNHWLLLARLRELGGEDREAGRFFRKACVVQPREPDCWLGLARVLRRDWLRTLDGRSLERAIAVLDTAALVRPGSSDVWLALCPLLYERPDVAGAADAAERSLRGHPRRPECLLAAALMSWRTGRSERADSLFTVALPRLAPDLRAMFEHPGRFTGIRSRRPPDLLTSTDDEPDSTATLGHEAWADDPGRDALPDPDPTTPENELLLEYRARVAHAYLLFTDPVRPGLDARAETYIRYGPPARVLLNPPGVPLTFRPMRDKASLADYPLDAQLWIYPELDMSILMNDRTLLGHYSTPALREPWPNSTPDKAALARRGDLLATGGGFAVFPTQAPRAQRLDVTATFAAFAGSGQPRLAAYLHSPGDSLEARWTVTDARGRVVARDAHAMGRSLCDPELRADVFTQELPPGRYDVAVSARDGHGRRGFVRDTVSLAPVGDALSLSDIVLSCGEPAMLTDRGAIRLEPLDARLVTGQGTLSAYFEIYHLAADADGLSRYTFDYRVERLSLDAKGRPVSSPTATTWASREETFRGTVRRQFLNVPMSTLAPGRYRLTVGAHDLLAGTSRAAAVEFEKH